MYRNSPGLYTTLKDLDCVSNDDKNTIVTTVWGDLYRSPFTRGFFVVNPEQSWQRLINGFREIGGVISTSVSALFLFTIAAINLLCCDRSIGPSGLCATAVIMSRKISNTC